MDDRFVERIVALQQFLLAAARDYPHVIDPTLATAATLDYALTLAREAASGADEGTTRGAIDEALAPACDDALRFLRALDSRDRRRAKAFCREYGPDGDMVVTLRSLASRPGVRDPERSFALITLADDFAAT